MNEFDLTGPQFLSMYVPATFATIFGAVTLRYILKIAKQDASDVVLTSYDAAYLCGGERRVIEAAVAKLIVSNVLGASLTPARIHTQNQLPKDADAIERSVYQAVQNHSISHVKDVARYVGSMSKRLRPKLVEAGLLVDDTRTSIIRVACTLLVAVPPIFWGLPKVVIGMERHKPVSFLIILCLASAVAAFWFLFQTVSRTARGDAAVAYMQDENRSLEWSAKYGTPATSDEMAMATGLFGAAIFMTSPVFASMRPVFSAPTSSGSGFSSGTSCGGGSCGGGGCGGGGCGGCGG